MRCIVCGDNIDKYAFIGKKGEVKAAFCVKHVPDCKDCDSCNLHCIVSFDKKIEKEVIT